MISYYNLAMGGFVDDPWVYVTDEGAIDEGAHVIVSLSRWRSGGDDIANAAQRIGVVVEPDDEFNGDSDRIKALSLVSVEFPAFTDGRGYSHARRLRDQLGFEGELRARGEVLIDQIPLMMRCGIDAFEVAHAPTIEALKSGSVPGLVMGYQAPVGTRFGRVQRQEIETPTDA